MRDLIPKRPLPAIVEIDDMTGKTSDFTQANNEMKKIDPNWKKPDDWTWHHKEDGVTMELVPREMHSKTGIPHAGGRFIVEDPGY